MDSPAQVVGGLHGGDEPSDGCQVGKEDNGRVVSDKLVDQFLGLVFAQALHRPAFGARLV